MTNEEFQKLVLEKLVSLEQGQAILERGQTSLEQGQKSLEQRFDQLDDKLENDVHEVLKLTYDKIEAVDRKLDSIATTQNIQGESINILCTRQLRSEAEFATFRKAK